MTFTDPRLEHIKNEISRLFLQANEITAELGEHFTYERFRAEFKSKCLETFRIKEKVYLQKENIYLVFEEYINQLESNGNIHYATSMTGIMKSFQRFAPHLKITDVTASFLYSYESDLLDLGRSISTVGIHARGMRTIFNYTINKRLIKTEAYPFGRRSHDKYSIPESNNKKKALDVDTIIKVRDAIISKKEVAFARDIWMFSLYCNGMLMGDIFNLKWDEIDGRYLRFQRRKTKRDQKRPVWVTVYLTDEAMRILKKWGRFPAAPDKYVFVKFSKNMSLREKHKRENNLIGSINHYMEKLCQELGVERITTYHARHSFATIQKYQGTPIEVISEALGHSTLTTTMRYMKSFPDETSKGIAEKTLTHLEDKGKTEGNV